MIRNPQPVEGLVAGINLSLKCFAVLSDGTRTESPKPLAKAERRLPHGQRLGSRKQRGSRNQRTTMAGMGGCTGVSAVGARTPCISGAGCWRKTSHGVAWSERSLVLGGAWWFGSARACDTLKQGVILKGAVPSQLNCGSRDWFWSTGTVSSTGRTMLCRFSPVRRANRPVRCMGH